MNAQDQDLYNDAPETKEPAVPGAESETKDQKTALLNSDICPDMEVGDEIVLKIVGKAPGEYRVAYSPSPEGETAEQAEPEPEEQPPGAAAAASEENPYA